MPVTAMEIMTVGVVWWCRYNCFAPGGNDNIIAETVMVAVVLTVMGTETTVKDATEDLLWNSWQR